MTLNITDNIKTVRDDMVSAAVKAGRDPSSIILVAACKTKDASMVRQAIIAGVDAAGENRVNELQEKKTEGAYEGVPLHFYRTPAAE